MPINHLFALYKEHESLLGYVKDLLRDVPYSTQLTKDATLFTIHFQSQEQETVFFATIKRNYPELLG